MLISQTVWNDSFFKRTKAAGELLNDHRPDLPGSPSTRLENSANAGIKHDTQTDSALGGSLASMHDNLRSPILAPYKYQTNKDNMFSIVWPITATDRLTVAPIISYIFPMNGFEKNDPKTRSLATSPEKDFSVIYGGVNLIYKF